MEMHQNLISLVGDGWIRPGEESASVATWAPDHTLRYRAYRPLLQTAALESPRGLQPKMHRSLALQSKLKGKSKSGSFTKS
jgi:hypothetical protein